MLKVNERLEGVDMKELGRINPLYMFSRIILLLLISAAAGAGILLGPLWAQIIGTIVLGLMYAHAVELQHQCLHNTAFSSKSWNRFVGFLLGLPTFVSHSDYQHQHLRHHRFLGREGDREFFNYGYDRLSLRTFIPHVFMVRHYRDVTVFIVQALFGGFKRETAKPEVTKKIRTEYRLFFLAIVVAVSGSFYFWTPIFVQLWLLPMLVAIPAHALIELPEHIGCDISTPNVLVNTRTIKAGRFANWFVHGNNYHAEHHWLPGIPNNKLHILHQKIKPDIHNLEVSYPAFFWHFFRCLMQGAELQKLGAQRSPQGAGN